MGPPPRALFSAGWALLALRGFLGFTFCFAGLQKLANPGFFDATNPASIQAQLEAANRRSPIHSLLGPLLHVAVPLGVLIALGELAVGLGTLLGLWTRLAAAGGAALSFLLFLTVSFHSSPYYTGSDIVFVFAWTPLVLAGSGGVLSLDAILANRSRRDAGSQLATVVPVDFASVRRVCGNFDRGRCVALRGAPCAPRPCPFLATRVPAASRIQEQELDRRTFTSKGLAAGAVGVVGLFGAGLVAALGRTASGSKEHSAAPSIHGTGAGPPSTSPASSSTTSVPPSSTTGPSRPPGTRIGPARDVPVGGAAQFRDPSTGDPALVVRPSAGTFLAFDAVCPHAGCTVEYDPRGHLFVCPCHGSEFNGRTGAVEVGPATSGLGRIGIAESSDGQLYVT